MAAAARSIWVQLGCIARILGPMDPGSGATPIRLQTTPIDGCSERERASVSNYKYTRSWGVSSESLLFSGSYGSCMLY